MLIVIVRHTTTDWNVAGRVQGHTDIPLNAQGRAEAAALAETIRPHRVTRVVSSDLSRAQETGAIIAHAIGVPHVSHNGLRECGFGKLEGLTVPELCALWGTSPLKNPDCHAYDFRPWDGEDADMVLARHLACFDALRVELGDDAVVCCVVHGRGIDTVLARYWNYPPITRNVVLALDYPHKT